MTRQKRQNYILAYVALDFLAALLAWTTLYYFRKFFIEGITTEGYSVPFRDSNFYVGLLLIPQIWLLLHYFSGSYTDVFRKSRLQEVFRTLLISLFGSVFIFFAFLLDDHISGYKDYYYTFFTLFLAQFSYSVILRVIFLNYIKKLLRSGKVGFNTLFIGTSQKIKEVVGSLSSRNDFGLIFKGVVYTEPNGQIANLPELGSLNSLDSVLHQNVIEEVILAVDTSQHSLLTSLLNDLGDKNVYIKIVPDMYDILSRTVKMNHVIGEAFIEISPVLIEEWERITKRWVDIGASAIALLLASPLLAVVAVLIKRESKGDVFYKQERLGQYGVPFMIYKFRSMYADAEANGAKLTVNNDPRITKTGQWLRKYRIDEIPQFFNVIKGDMSIVGPRAERKVFAEQLEKLEPNYPHIFKVKPGITSLGMVKYGYASTVEEMLPRLKYDLIYIENMSMTMDFKILLYTISTVIYGRGK